MKAENPGAKALSYWRGVVSQGLKALLPRLKSGAPTASSPVAQRVLGALGARQSGARKGTNNRCGKYSDWLTDAALGELAVGREPELLAHAAECDACREAYRHAREVSAFADQIDRGVESLVSGEPSPHFNSRLRARIAGDEASPWRITWHAWTPIAAGLVALAILLVAFVSRTPRTNPPSVADKPNVTIGPSHTTNPPAPPPVISAANRPTVATSPSRDHGVKRAKSHRGPEVLVEPGQLAATIQFADALRSGRIDGPKLLAAQQRLDAPLEIKPLEIAPLSPPQPDTVPDTTAPSTHP